MARYIEADEALKNIKKMLYETALNNFDTDRKFADDCEEIAEHRLATWIDYVPTADVVEVVRCKDCKDSERKDYMPAKYCNLRYCKNSLNYHDKDFYCAMGEKRDE